MAEPQPPRFAIPPLPPGWDKLARAPRGTLWAAVQQVDLDDPGGFRATLVLTCDDLGGLGFREWQVGTDETLPRLLADYLLVDLERLEIDGRSGGRRLAHHVDPAGRALTMEQWFVHDERRGWTLTATTDTWTYDALADECAAVAAAWRPVSGVEAGRDD